MSTTPCGSLVRRSFAILAALLILLALGTSATAGPAALYVTDGDFVHAFDATSGAPLAGFTNVSLLFAGGVAVGPDGNLYVATSNPAPGSVYRYDAATGAQIGSDPFVTYNGQNDGHDVIIPAGMHFGPDGNLYIADEGTSDIHVYDSSGNSLGTIEGDSVVQPTDLAFDTTRGQPAGNVFTPTGATANVLVSTGLGNNFADFTAPTAGGLANPTSLAFGPDHELYVLDIGNGAPMVARFTAAGAFDTTVVSFTGNNFFQPAYIAFGPDGNFYLSGQDLLSGDGEIQRYATDGTFLGNFITGLGSPTFMAFSVPEPATGSLAALALASLIACSRRRRTR